MGLARQQFRHTWRIHGTITDGGVKPNIIPDFTRAQFIIRAPTMDEVTEAVNKVVACAQGAATATGCKLEYGPPSSVISDELGPIREVRVNSVLARLVVWWDPGVQGPAACPCVFAGFEGCEARSTFRPFSRQPRTPLKEPHAVAALRFKAESRSADSDQELSVSCRSVRFEL